MGVVFSAQPGLFKPGDTVMIRSDTVDHHHRTPWFIKGKTGVVRAVSGPFFNPESRAHDGTGIPKRLLYQVEFNQTQVWDQGYTENARDVLVVDVYEQWLKPAPEETTR